MQDAKGRVARHRRHAAAKSQQGQRIDEARRTLFVEQHLGRLEPTPGARELLLRCRAEGLRLVVATSAGGDKLQALLVQAGVADLVHGAVSSSDVQARKPDPDIVEAALREAGVGCVVLRCGGWWTDASFVGAFAVCDDPADLLRRWDTMPFRVVPNTDAISGGETG